MAKIELHQLAFYLDYKLKIKTNVLVNDNHVISEMVACKSDYTIKDTITISSVYSNIPQFKPILKSISDISQGEINELFEMFGDLCRIGNQLHFNEFLKEHFEHLDTLPLLICQELAKRGYDIFNLLENNLAISFYSC